MIMSEERLLDGHGDGETVGIPSDIDSIYALLQPQHDLQDNNPPTAPVIHPPTNTSSAIHGKRKRRGQTTSSSSSQNHQRAEPSNMRHRTNSLSDSSDAESHLFAPSSLRRSNSLGEGARPFSSHSTSDFDGPQWLRQLVTPGPSVLLAFEIRKSSTGVSKAYYKPWRSFSGLGPSQISGVDMDENSTPQSFMKGKESALLMPSHDTGHLAEPAHSYVGNPPALGARQIPLEIFEHIVQYLTREDVKNMRLVDKAFEQGVSAYMFGTVVVPFSTEVYGMLRQQHGFDAGKQKSNGKGKARASSFGPQQVDILKALDIFRGFGPHIRRYGMSFEVAEKELAIPPEKAYHQNHAAYWGPYCWPFPDYRRFADRANLEIAADETSTMKRAFSNLTGVQHLALSLDGKLGWLNGGDVSLRASVLRRDSRIFPLPTNKTPANVEAQREFWTALQTAYQEIGSLDELKYAELFRLHHAELSPLFKVTRTQPSQTLPDSILTDIPAAELISGKEFDSFPGFDCSDKAADAHTSQEDTTDDATVVLVAGRPYNVRGRGGRPASTRTGQGAPGSRTTYALADNARVGSSGVLPQINTLKGDAIESVTPTKTVPASGILLLKRPNDGLRLYTPRDLSLIPKSLSRGQTEWLLETRWAQEAFLSSYMLAISDTPTAFGNVQSLTLSRFSSRHLPKLSRPDFWTALPALATLTIEIIADWRDIEKDHGGDAMLWSIDPSSAGDSLYALLRDRVAVKESIKTLSIGWTDGGEHAEGLNARNKHNLPAPVAPINSLLSHASDLFDMLMLPHVEHLTLVNSWATPNGLRAFISAHASESLKSVKLESFSLTTHPRFPRPNRHVLAPLLPAPLQNAPYTVPHLPVAAFAAQPVLPHQQLPPHVHQANQQLLLNQLHQVQQGQFAQGQQQFLQQMQQQIQQLQQQMMQTVQAAVPQQNPQQNPQPNPQQNAVPVGVREGSWSDVLGDISSDYIKSGPRTIDVKLLSCGYVRLSASHDFDQTVLDNAVELSRRGIFTQYTEDRLHGMSHGCMTSRDPLLGELVTFLPAGEMPILQATWGLHPGWPVAEEVDAHYDDEDGWGKWGWRSMEAAEYNGAQPGGSGRFSGKVVGFAEVMGDDE